jgi:hypothetical protein
MLAHPSAHGQMCHGRRRPATHVFEVRQNYSRWWPAFAGHNTRNLGEPSVNHETRDLGRTRKSCVSENTAGQGRGLRHPATTDFSES